MILINSDSELDRKLYPVSWRETAAAIGIINFLDYCDYENIEVEYEIGEDSCGVQYLKYRSSDIQGEEFEHNYLKYVEYRYEKRMHHRLIEDILKSENTLTEGQVKLVNDKLSGNSICKKVFKELKKYSEGNRKNILDLIEENRDILIKETYRNTVFKSINNANTLFSEPGEIARLNNYYVDLPKKKKSLAFNWNYDTYDCQDYKEYDFIPFAFTDSPIKFFINCNSDLKSCVKLNNELQEIFCDADNLFQFNLYEGIRNVARRLYYNVEIIKLDTMSGNEYFETIILRENAIKIFKELHNKKWDGLKGSCKLDDGTYLKIGDIVAEHIVNKLFLDDVILLLLKQDQPRGYYISRLIKVNMKLYQEVYKSDKGEETMAKGSDSVKETGEKIRKKLIEDHGKNKVNSYRQKLATALSVKDYDKFCNILLQLSSYAEIPMDFAYDLFDDFDVNKNIAFSFVNSLAGKEESSADKEGESK